MDENKLSYSERILMSSISQRSCHVCGKAIVRLSFSDYAYKEGKYTFCSWTCLCKYRRDPSRISHKKFNNPISNK